MYFIILPIIVVCHRVLSKVIIIIIIIFNTLLRLNSCEV